MRNPSEIRKDLNDVANKILSIRRELDAADAQRNALQTELFVAENAPSAKPAADGVNEITCEIDCGVSIGHAAIQATQLAKQIGGRVKFNFNQTPVVAGPMDEPNNVVDRYYNNRPHHP